MAAENIKYQDIDKIVEKLAFIETERFRKIFNQKGFEAGITTVGRVLALYRVLIDTDKAHEQEMAALNEKIVTLEKSLIFSNGEQQGKVAAARRGANARGAKYATMKSQALSWYAEARHQFQNKNEAALALTKLHSVEFGTARSWLKGV